MSIVLLSSAGLCLDAPALVALIHPADIQEAWLDACVEFDHLYTYGEVVQYDVAREDDLAQAVVNCFTNLIHRRMRAILDAAGRTRHRLELDVQFGLTVEYEDCTSDAPYDFVTVLHLREFTFNPVVTRFDEDRDSDDDTVVPHSQSHLSDDDSP